VDRPKVDSASLLFLSVLLKVVEILDLRFTTHHFYLDLFYSPVIDISLILLD